VKIATAITKLIHPFIWYATQEIASKSFMIYVKSWRTIALIINTTAQKNTKKSGRESILSIGRIVTLITQRIIPPIKYVFHASI